MIIIMWPGIIIMIQAFIPYPYKLPSAHIDKMARVCYIAFYFLKLKLLNKIRFELILSARHMNRNE